MKTKAEKRARQMTADLLRSIGIDDLETFSYQVLVEIQNKMALIYTVGIEDFIRDFETWMSEPGTESKINPNEINKFFKNYESNND